MVIILLKVCDIFTTIFQVSLITWSCHNIAFKRNKISKCKSWLLAFILSTIIIGFTYSNVNSQYANFIMVLACISVCVIFYRKSITDGLLGFGIFYTMSVITCYILLAFYQQILTKMNFGISSELQLLLFIYIPVWVVYISYILFKNYIFNAILYIKTYANLQTFLIIFLYLLIILDALRVKIQTQNIDTLMKLSFYFITFIIFLFAIIYFAKINEKSKEVKMLNKALQEKITELKKVKHDYGSEVSSFYGLYQLGKIDRLGELLKSVIEKGKALDTSIYLKMNASPLVNSILVPVAYANIDVIVSDIADYENLALSDDELLKILSNIVKNSVDVLNGVEVPIIKFKSYNTYNGIAITISNNGAEIPKNVKLRMFEPGFSTKDNSTGDRGYGLSNVADIIHKCGGQITVDSNRELTQFNIEVPYKDNKEEYKDKWVNKVEKFN